MQWGHNGTNSYNTPQEMMATAVPQEGNMDITEMPASAWKDSAQWSCEMSAMNTAHNSQPEPPEAQQDM